MSFPMAQRACALAATLMRDRHARACRKWEDFRAMRVRDSDRFGGRDRPGVDVPVKSAME